MISLIVALSDNNVIGKDNDLPWRLPDDLKQFRALTEGYPIIMGRKCYESIGRPLPNRQNIIITRQADYAADGCDVVGSLEAALALAEAADTEEIFIVGGGEIYRQGLPHTDRLYLTRVHADIDGDVLFPEVEWNEWELQASDNHSADDRHAHSFTFETWERKH